MKYLAAIFLVPAIACGATSSLESVRQTLHKYGDNQFSAQISSRAWSDALANISAEKSDWLTLVPTLASALDSIKAQELRNALYYALAPNARETLKILAILDNQKNRYQQGTATSCIYPSGQSPERSEKIYYQTRLALLDAGPQAATCLWILEGWHEQIRHAAEKN